MLIARFYMVMQTLVTELTYVPDYTALIPAENRLPIFLCRTYTEFGRGGADRLSDSLYDALKESEQRGEYHAVTDWL